MLTIDVLDYRSYTEMAFLLEHKRVISVFIITVTNVTEEAPVTVDSHIVFVIRR